MMENSASSGFLDRGRAPGEPVPHWFIALGVGRFRTLILKQTAQGDDDHGSQQRERFQPPNDPAPPREFSFGRFG
jgi:hypothetical protein